jgi:hypothetical protein
MGRGAAARAGCRLEPQPEGLQPNDRRSALRRRSPRSRIDWRPSRTAASHWSNPPASPALRIILGQLRDQRSERAATFTVPVTLRFRQAGPAKLAVRPCCPAESGAHCSRDSVGVVRDHGFDQGLLVSEVMVDLRSTNSGRLLDIREGRAAHAMLEHELRRHRNDSVAGCPPLRSEPALICS